MSDTDETLDIESDTEVVVKEELITESDEQPTYDVKVEKKQRGRPKKPIEEKLAKQIITKEKIIYMVQNDKGDYEKIKKPKFTARELKKMELEKEKEKKEIELGKKLIQKKNGKIDKRSIGGNTRTPAQIEATKRLVEANKKRRAEKDDYKKKEVKSIVKESVREVVSEPFYVPKKEPVSSIPDWMKYGF